MDDVWFILAIGAGLQAYALWRPFARRREDRDFVAAARRARPGAGEAGNGRTPGHREPR